MDKINNLIIHLMAVQGVAKNVHYNMPDYAYHLLADRVQNDLNGFIDELKENCILAKGSKPLNSSKYYLEASKLTSDIINLLGLKDIIVDTLVVLEQINDLSIGDSDLLGRIGSNLQNSLGVLNIVLGDKK